MNKDLYVVCCCVGFLNNLKIISHNFTDIEDAFSFRLHCKETEKYKNKTLLILKVID